AAARTGEIDGELVSTGGHRLRWPVRRKESQIGTLRIGLRIDGGTARVVQSDRQSDGFLGAELVPLRGGGVVACAQDQAEDRKQEKGSSVEHRALHQGENRDDTLATVRSIARRAYVRTMFIRPEQARGRPRLSFQQYV